MRESARPPARRRRGPMITPTVDGISNYPPARLARTARGERTTPSCPTRNEEEVEEGAERVGSTSSMNFATTFAPASASAAAAAAAAATAVTTAQNHHRRGGVGALLSRRRWRCSPPHSGCWIASGGTTTAWRGQRGARGALSSAAAAAEAVDARVEPIFFHFLIIIRILLFFRFTCLFSPSGHKCSGL